MKLINDFAEIDEHNKIFIKKYPEQIHVAGDIYNVKPNDVWDIVSIVLTGSSYMTIESNKRKITIFENWDTEMYEINPKDDPEYFI